MANTAGVGVYVANELLVKVFNKNELNSECEDIWLQITDKNSQEIFTAGVIYHLPGTDVKNFIDVFNNNLSKLNPLHKYYVLGDIKINVHIISST